MKSLTCISFVSIVSIATVVLFVDGEIPQSKNGNTNKRPKGGHSPLSTVFMDRSKLGQRLEDMVNGKEMDVLKIPKADRHNVDGLTLNFKQKNFYHPDWEMNREHLHTDRSPERDVVVEPRPLMRGFSEQGGTTTYNDELSGGGGVVAATDEAGGGETPLVGTQFDEGGGYGKEDMFDRGMKRNIVKEKGLSQEDQLAEMSTFDIQLFLQKDDPTKIDEEKLSEYLRGKKVGSLFNSPSAVNLTYMEDVESWRARIQLLYEKSVVMGTQSPLLYALDSVHGVNYIYNATLFPHQIGIAATFSDEAAYRVGQLTGLESRYAGIPWNFAPILDVAVQPTWPRVFETFGEDTLLVSRMGVNITRGLQSPAPDFMNPPTRTWCPTMPPTPAPHKYTGPPIRPEGPTVMPLKPLNLKTTEEEALRREAQEVKDSYFSELNDFFSELDDSQSQAQNRPCPYGAIPLVAATMKHFIGYSDSRTGHDRTPAYVPMNKLLNDFLPPFDAAAYAGILTVMEAYTELNGRPVVGNAELLNFTLRGVLDYHGTMVSDYNEVFNQVDFHRSYSNYTSALVGTFHDTTLDMCMTGLGGPYPNVSDALPPFIDEDKHREGDPESVNPGYIEESANRILNLKEKLGLNDGSPVWHIKEGACAFGCRKHKQHAHRIVIESATLLQNNFSTLPLDFDLLNNISYSREATDHTEAKAEGPAQIAVIGPACDSIPLMSGGWTANWQGTSNKSAFSYGSTIYEELLNDLPSANITFFEGCPVEENSDCSPATIATAASLAARSDVVFLCLGETHYAEKPGDIDNMMLPGKQIEMVTEISSAVKNPASTIVTILIQGRPRILGTIPQLVGPIFYAYLPGPSGGRALVDLLKGKYWPSGRLPITYPKTVNNAPLQYSRPFSANSAEDYNVQWSFGWGLQYGSGITYEGFTVRLDRFGWFHVSVKLNYNRTFVYSDGAPDNNSGEKFGVKSSYGGGGGGLERQMRNVYSINKDNTGAIENATPNKPVSHTVLLFAHQLFRKMPDAASRLRDYGRQVMTPGFPFEPLLNLTFNVKDFQYYDELNCKQLEPGPVRLWVGVASTGSPRTFEVTTKEERTMLEETMSLTISQLDQGQQQLWRGFLQTDLIYQSFHFGKECGLWGTYYELMTNLGYQQIQNQTIKHVGFHTQTSEFLISSIICFGAGVVGTFILVQWLMLSRRRKEQRLQEQAEAEAALLEQNSQAPINQKEIPERPITGSLSARHSRQSLPGSGGTSGGGNNSSSSARDAADTSYLNSRDSSSLGDPNPNPVLDQEHLGMGRRHH